MLVENAELLPELLYEVLSENRPPVEGEIHVTQLIGPPLVDYLRREYWDDLVDDASNRLFALLGQGLHAAIANDGRIQHAKKVIGELIRDWNKIDRDIQLCILQDLLASLDSTNQSGIESTLRWKLNDHWTLVGTDDHYDELAAKVMDWKITSVWSVLFADHNWEEQCNMYGYMRRKNGYEVEALEVWALLRDWQKSKAKYSGDPRYPKIPFVRVPLRVWSMDECEDYIENRIKLFVPGKKPRPCTPEEKWQTPTLYKVMKKNRKSALIASHYIDGEKRDLLSVAEALEAAEKKNVTVDGTQIYIQEFKGENKRCSDYCSVNQFCEAYCGGDK